MLQRLKKSSKGLCRKYKNKVVDVLLFGSAIKGKFEPEDIDIAIILRNTKQEELIKERNEIAKFFDKKVHLNLILIETLIENPIFKTLIEEGYSLLSSKKLCYRLGYESAVIFMFGLKKLSNSKKVLFSYALHGKNGREGMIQKTNSKELGKAVILTPTEKQEEFKSFLDSWQIDYRIMMVLKS